MAQEWSVHFPTPPAVIDNVHLRNIQLHLPMGPDPWHRSGKSQPCTASMKLSYSSAIAAAAADDVSLSLDYGKLYRFVEAEVRDGGRSKVPIKEMMGVSLSQKEAAEEILLGGDVRIIAGMIANCGLTLLDETVAGVRRMSHVHLSPTRQRRGSEAGRRMSGGPVDAQPRAQAGAEALDGEYGQCEVWLHLPNALLRAEEGLKYRCVMVWGYKEIPGRQEDAVDSERRPMVREQEFRIDGIRCHCILGVNSHERLEKQAVIVSLEFSGPGHLPWASTVVETYPELTRVVAERVEATSYQTVEALATFIARIVTVEFGNDRVTVKVEKPSALAFVERAGVEITRSRAFFIS
ncbi:dihydroneopterin aldolase domain protein [Paecilomyces variotii No. 5]|uniref:dihydroneopterin aldolase n=1 Tax=Byssochlamys spectabilis (strain No. 5 / NBRC 109023) TaxID=1356009 RepID=V5HXQ8_BYSSN|nr:dihydroneopterin aldolase domain protein [Paecilomyces variotii No. 5]